MHGIYRKPLEDILEEQSRNPELTLFLQPYTGRAIKRLLKNPPSPKSPVTLYASTTEQLHDVCYTAEIVGWENKLSMPPARHTQLEAIIRQYQPTEDGLYNASPTENKPSLNLLHVRRMTKLDPPFSVTQLVKVSDGEPLALRTRPGGHSYVRKLG